MQFLAGYKTVIFNTLVLIAGLTQSSGLMTLVPEAYMPLALLVIGVANLVLRFATTTGIFQKA